MHDRKHLCHFWKARGRIELSMIVTYFQCLTLRVRSGHLSNALTRERSWLTEKLVSPPYQSQSVVDRFTYYTNTLQWPHFGPTVQPLGDPWTKWSQRTGLDNFFFLFYFIIFYFFFGLKLRGTRHLATRLQNTLQWPHFGPTVQPLGDPWTKWSQRTGLDIFSFLFYFIIFFFLRTQIARNKTSGYMVTKYPPVTPLRANSTTVRRPLDKMKPKDWLRQFFPVLFYVRTQVATLNKTSRWLSWL